MAEHIAAKVVPDYNGNEVIIPNLDKISLRLANKENLTNIGLERVSFMLEGNAVIVSGFNETELIKKLTTSPDKNYEKIFAQYPNIDRVEISFQPPWLRTIPKDPERVKVEIIIEGVK